MNIKKLKTHKIKLKPITSKKSLENLKNLNEISSQNVLVKPVPPRRNETTNYESYSYATLPKKRFNQNLNLVDNVDSSILMQQLEPTPPAMPLISISPVTKGLKSHEPSKLLANNVFTSNGNGNINTANNLIKNVNSKIKKPTVQVTKHVLNDIDSMLCDLNRQLDEMLDYEKVVFRV